MNHRPIDRDDEAVGAPPVTGGSRSVGTNTTNNFDLIRLVAATEVALRHCLVHLGYGDSPWLGILGIFPGVPIFFFISGFLIFQSFRVSASLRQYAINRVLRIYPALLVCFALAVMAVVLTGYLKPSQLRSSEFLLWAAAQTTFVQIYNPGFMRGFGTGVLNGSMWTVAVELQFYVLTPVLAWLCMRRRWGWALAVVVGMGANLAMVWWHGSWMAKLFAVSFPPWFYMFILGAWLSTQPEVQRRISNIKVRFLLGAYGLVSLAGWSAGWQVTGNEINPLSYVVLSALIFKLAYTNRGLANRLLQRNDISYGVYIYHMPVVNVIIQTRLAWQLWNVAAAMAATVCLALASWRFIERPALRLKRVALRRY